MLIEDLRFVHEDIERLEQAIAERLEWEPHSVRERQARDHQISGFVERIRIQSQRALDLYEDASKALYDEDQQLKASDSLDAFRERLHPIRDFHKRNPNEPVENLERTYKQPPIGPEGSSEIDNLFSAEEAYGRYFDLLGLHEDYNNIRKKRSTYLQYLDTFDSFEFLPKADKMRENYFAYLDALWEYILGFMRRTRPLEDIDAFVASLEKEHDEKWDKGEIAGWKSDEPAARGEGGPVTEGSGSGIWCADCRKEFTNPNVYKAHLTAKKHLKNAAARKAEAQKDDGQTQTQGANRGTAAKRLKERAISHHEFMIHRFVKAMQLVRDDTRVNVERRQGMTEKERAQEIEATLAENPQSTRTADGEGAGDDGDEDERTYNPLRLPLQWDGKPIPFWLYKLHGLGVEFPCEICGNYVYMGRRAYDKHFQEPRHLYGLRCLGITNSALFREITKISEAEALWEKVRKDKRAEMADMNDVEQMEDREGNVMPLKVYNDLAKQGLL